MRTNAAVKREMIFIVGSQLEITINILIFQAFADDDIVSTDTDIRRATGFQTFNGCWRSTLYFSVDTVTIHGNATGRCTVTDTHNIPW